MRRISFLALIPAGLMVCSCRERVQANNNLLPELAACDSAAIMYYKEPGKPRFFKMTKTQDVSAIRALSENVNGPLISDKDSCTSQGKIYGYGKGDAVYVVYFSRQAGCMSLSFIKTGEKYFVGMKESTRKWLDDLESSAMEPVAKSPD